MASDWSVFICDFCICVAIFFKGKNERKIQGSIFDWVSMLTFDGDFDGYGDGDFMCKQTFMIN